jgi:hypothetical protein
LAAYGNGTANAWTASRNWRSQCAFPRKRVNRDQIRDGANILGDVVPIVIHLMMENAQGVWGDACYPVVE